MFASIQNIVHYISVGFWTDDRIKAFLSGVPDNRMIILDLNSEQSPIWSKTQSYYGKPFVWCLLHNYGGTRGIYGNLTTIASGPVEALKAPGSTMAGVGITPEAIEHNPVVYDLMVRYMHIFSLMVMHSILYIIARLFEV